MGKKNEFRPDTHRQDFLGKLLLTRKQRQTVLRWTLYALVCLLALLVQDVIMSRILIFDTTTELVPCFILAICVLQGVESGCVFTLVASLIYYFSGSAPGIWCVPVLTTLAVVATIFRQAYLRQGLLTLLLCVSVSMVLYELSNFGIGLFLNLTYPARLKAFLLTAVLTMAALPVMYPILMSIGKIGGETWKE
ncbi:MAG: hypothetical protein E7466_04345 [Ruminococcaceae bacterium]|nr:hypothetical protein [Oscillospiraceae bacterium]MBQ3214966.1 hypothetical protein [Oscillospiraceae bacterium]